MPQAPREGQAMAESGSFQVFDVTASAASACG
jgi:hypothetical protein